MLKYGTIETALVFLKENRPYRVGDLLLGIDEEHDFFVTGSSGCFYFESITKSGSLKELQEIKALFNKMVAQSPGLAAFVKGRKVKYHLAFDDGRCGIGICSEENDVITWMVKLSK